MSSSMEETQKILAAACWGLKLHPDVNLFGASLAKELDRMGYDLVKRKEVPDA